MCWELAVQLRRDIKPRLDAANVKLLLVSIGNPTTGKEFAKNTEFPEDCLYADNDNVCYDALNFYSGFMRTFFDKSTANSMKERFSKNGADDLKNVMRDNYKPLMGVKDTKQTLIQGGLICFNGGQSVFFHKDQGTGAHADFDAALDTLGA